MVTSNMIFSTDPSAGTITMRGGIGDFENHISADDFQLALAEHAGADVTIHLDSPGGSVTDGLSIYNAISTYSGKVTVHVDSIAASIASVIAVAADHVIINSTGRFMVHNSWTVSAGNANDFLQVAAVMQAMDKDIAATYASKTEISAEIWQEIMDAETWFSAREALSMGLVDEINDVRAPKASSTEEIVAETEEIVAETPKTESIGLYWQAKIEATARRIRLKTSSK